MTRRFLEKAAVLLAATWLVGGPVFAPAALGQAPPPPPGGPGFGGRGGPRRPMTAVRVPVAALASGLKLTASQRAKIQAIQSRVRQQRDARRPRPGGPSDGGPPEPNAMRANFGAMRALEQKAGGDIQATLTKAQKQALAPLLKRLDVWRTAGIPLELFGKLNLAGGQEQKIAALVNKNRPPRPSRPGNDPGAGRAAREQSRRKVHEQAMALLSASQRKMVTAYRNAHPRPPFGGGPGDGPPPPPPPGGPF